jgi:predicted ATP-grasp superfamily ATP-dependent carboligase
MASVLLTDAEERSVVAAARSLQRAGHRVAAAGRSRLAPAHWSRACRERHLVPDPRRDAPGFVAGLEALLCRGGYDVLVPGSDVSLPLISQARARLAPHTQLGLPDDDVVRACGDKEVLLSAGAEAGLAPPPTVVCGDSDEASAAARELGYPLIVKPIRSAASERGAVRQRPAGFVATEAELHGAVGEAGQRVLVQRFERPLAHLSCGGVAAGGRVRGLVVARFHRTWPVRSGAAAFAETVEPPDGLAAGVARLLEALGWRGIFELEVLVLEDGRMCAIDFNPRVFGWLALAIAAGADLPRAWLESLLGGGAAETGPARAGLRYRWEDGDACWAAWHLRRGRLRQAAAALRPARNVTHAHFRLTDPGPLPARALWVLSRRYRRS